MVINRRKISSAAAMVGQCYVAERNNDWASVGRIISRRKNNVRVARNFRNWRPVCVGERTRVFPEPEELGNYILIRDGQPRPVVTFRRALCDGNRAVGLFLKTAFEKVDGSEFSS